MPIRIEPGVNYLRIGELADEFTQQWNRLQAFYLDAAVGFNLVRDHVVAEQERARSHVQGTDLDSEKFQDTRMFTYARMFSEDFCTSGIHRSAQGKVKSRNKIDGENFNTLGQLCIVSFCTFWNEYLRREYVVAKGTLNVNEKDDGIVKRCLHLYASEDIWGDLNILRNCIVHNHGLANMDIKRCKIIKWFKPRGQILITSERMRAILLALLIYKNKLYAERFPSHSITVTT